MYLGAQEVRDCLGVKKDREPGRRSCAERCQRMSVCAGWGTKAPGSSAMSCQKWGSSRCQSSRGLLEVAGVSDPKDWKDKGQEATHSP